MFGVRVLRNIKNTTHLLKQLNVNQVRGFSVQSSSSNKIDNKILRTGRFSSQINKVINFLPAGHNYVIERFGKFHKVATPGLNILVPFVDQIAYAVDTRELCLRIDPEAATTEDNVRVNLGGNLYLQFADAEKASYGASNPIYAVSQLAQSVMRSAVGKIKLDKLFSERNILNETVIKNLSEDVVGKWGCKVLRFEITDLEAVDKAVIESLHKQSTAERDRREKVIAAEAYQRDTEIRAEANKKKVELEADAYRYQKITHAQGEAESIIKIAEAQKEGLRMLSEAVSVNGGQTAVTTRLTEQYLATLKAFGEKGNTLIIPQNMGDVSAMLAMGKTVLEKTNAVGKTN